MPDKKIKFYWDVGSTNTYFAFHLLRPLAQQYQTDIEYIPFNLGYVFRHHDYALTQEPKAKMQNRKDDLMRWAKRYKPKFRVPDRFPIKTSRALRGALVAREHNLEVAYMDEIFRRYWEENDPTIADYDGLRSSIETLGLDYDSFVERAESPELRQLFIDTTQQALADGVFGAPIMVMDDEIYWGKDRFEFVEDHLKRWASS